jgi:hypothetical protein
MAGDIVQVDCVLLGVFGIRCANLEDKPLFLWEIKLSIAARTFRPSPAFQVTRPPTEAALPQRPLRASEI